LSRPSSVAAFGLALVFGGFVLGCAGDEETTPTPTPTTTSTTAATTTSTPEPTTTSTGEPGTPTATATADPEVEPRQVTGLDAPLGDLPEVEAQPLPEMPASSFSPWDGRSVMLYDVVEMAERNLGPGQFASFSPDGSRLAWVAGEPGLGEEAFVLELPDGEPRSLGPARTTRWLSNDEVVVHPPQPPGQNRREIVDITTGERREDEETVSEDAPRSEVIGSYRFERTPASEYPLWRYAYRVTDLRSAAVPPLAFEATAAALTSGGRLFVLAPPPEPSGPPANMGPHMEWGLANLFEVDVETGEVTLIATTVATAPNTPLAASSRYVAWADNFCGLPDAGLSRTLIHDLATERLVAFDRGAWVTLTERDELGIGEFGPRALLDLDTLEYSVVIDPNGFDIAWSSDYRYAARGFAGGHGGLCG